MVLILSGLQRFMYTKLHRNSASMWRNKADKKKSVTDFVNRKLSIPFVPFEDIDRM